MSGSRRGRQLGTLGGQDERGAANLLTPEVVLAAVGAAEDGRVIALGMPISGSTSGTRGSASAAPCRPSAAAALHVCRRWRLRRGRSPDQGRDGGRGRRADRLAPRHDHPHRRLGRTCGGRTSSTTGTPPARVRSYGATRCGIDKVGPIVARGVLLDVAAHLGVAALPAHTRIDADLLADVAADRWRRRSRAGDVVLVRTGWATVFAADPAGYQDQQPGLTYDGARWLVDRDVVAIGSRQRRGRRTGSRRASSPGRSTRTCTCSRCGGPAST